MSQFGIRSPITCPVRTPVRSANTRERVSIYRTSAGNLSRGRIGAERARFSTKFSAKYTITLGGAITRGSILQFIIGRSLTTRSRTAPANQCDCSAFGFAGRRLIALYRRNYISTVSSDAFYKLSRDSPRAYSALRVLKHDPFSVPMSPLLGRASLRLSRGLNREFAKAIPRVNLIPNVGPDADSGYRVPWGSKGRNRASSRRCWRAESI